MKKLIDEIKNLCMELYGAEISDRDVLLFNTLGQEACQQIVEVLKNKDVPDDVISASLLQD